MKHFWALPAILRVALASQHAFSVLDDLLAFPQYRIVFSETGITPEHARSLSAASLAHREARPESESTVELSHQTYAHDSAQNPFKGPDNGDDHKEEDEDLPSTYETLIWRSQPYLCRIPKVSTSTDSANASTPTAAEEETELMRATDRGWELLSGMEGNCIYFLSGWWSYSFCYNGEIKQFHQLPPSRGVPYYPPVEDETVTSFILGQFPEPTDDEKSKSEDNGEGSTEGDSEGSRDDHASQRRAKRRIPDDTSIARLETKGETRYLVQKLSGGTTCDLTGKDRKIEVQFHCHPNTPDRIGMIKEVATCAYLMVIYTPRLCNDVAFLPPTENSAHAIDCAPVVDEDGLASPPPSHGKPAASGSQDTNIDIPDALGDSAARTPAPLPTIGGTVVGAKALVGDTPERTIEKSVVVGGGKETVLGTVASSDGHGKITTMKTEELRKLDIKDPRDIENLKRKLTSLAGKKGWRLELVETPRGREFRGVIEADDGEDEDVEEVVTDREGGKESRKKAPEEQDAEKEDGEEGDQGESTEEGSEETFFTEEL
ncbi:hypothetical protein K490DRAFT_46290 [Saccharata proteae CBS 121410]|uniref:Endoplasmic reticulum lectin n=1 Tax=Saccharata proteae CBS 121410 TaxID=1314787 RepID=A0A9P4HSK5_9PEZI|nr:hypothetical protein K490DRAFT_46290 [Saccharata proteae CBS 121410]